MSAAKPPELEPWLDLASAQLRQRRWEALEQTATLILQREPGQELAQEWLGVARAARTSNVDEAIRLLRPLRRVESMFNLGVFLAQSGRTTEAIVQYERVLAQRPNFAAAWYRLGEARRECGDTLGAMDAFRRTLEIDPSHARARDAYLYVATGRNPPGSG
jgi:protein O-GlcNAc transferase